MPGFPGSPAGEIQTVQGVAGAVPLPASTNYQSPDGRQVVVGSNMGVLFSDDFGGNAVDTAVRWTVLDGGLGANPNLGGGTLTQSAIGSGVTGITDSVSGSALTVSMGTTNNAERWYLSNQIFAGQEDLTVILSRSQALAANSIFIGMVEVDLATGVPLLNPNLAGDFTNRGGVDFGLSTGTKEAFLQAVADSSGSVASVANTAFTVAAMTTTFEAKVEFHAEDIIASSCTVDATTGMNGQMRISTQCPNDGKAYKLLMRFHNVSTPGSNTTVVIQRILLVDGQEMRVEIASGRGDVGNPQKSVAVTLTGASANTTILGSVSLGPQANQGTSTTHKLTSAATTNATSVKAATGTVTGGYLRNRAASERYFKLYNKASAPTVGTDVPVLTVGLAAASQVGIADIVGAYGFNPSAGIAYAITGAYADNDATAVAAGDVDVNLIYA